MENEMEYIPETEVERDPVRLPDVTADAHFDFKLEGWPAAAVLMSLWAAGVLVCGIVAWSKTRATPAVAAAS